MGFYTSVVYPAMLGVFGATALLGLVTLVWTRAHGVLKWSVTAVWILTAVQLVVVAVLLVGDVDAPLLTTIGYLLVSVALLPLFGIGRLGEPEAAATDPDPNRPVLAPDQVARVDAVAALILAVSLVVVSWRLEQILVTAA
jgi:hypothetical protein